MCRELAGFTGGQADMVRKGCAKKIAHILNEYHGYFVHGSVEKGIPGCVNRGIKEEVAESIWAKMESFGRYAFNKSHSVTYSVTSAVTAWLSCYFPVEYMTAVINSYLGNAKRINGYLGICRQRDIVIYPPDINKSLAIFSTEDGGVRFGLQGLKHVGSNAVPIVNERLKNGPYKDIKDFVERTTAIGAFQSNIFESLCYAGCFDSFEGTRKDKLDAKEQIVTYSKTIKDIRKNRQMLVSDIISIDNNTSTFVIKTSEEELPKKKMLEKEYEIAGFYISEHPLDAYGHYLRNKNIVPLSFLQADDEDDIPMDTYINEEGEEEVVEGNGNIKNGDKVTVAAIIKDVEIKHRASDGAKFAKLRLEDQSGDINAIIFTKRYNAYESRIQNEKIGIFEGTYKVDEYGPQIMINSVVDIESAADISIRSIYLVADKEINEAKRQYIKIKKLIEAKKGEGGNSTRVYFRQKKGTFPMGSISLDIDVLDAIYNIMNGEHNVTINHYK